MKIGPPAVLLALLLVLPSCPGEDADDAGFDPSAGPFRLHILVLDGDADRPAGDIVVYLQDSGGLREKGRTAADGRYDFGYLRPGPYAVAVGRRMRGFVPAVERVQLAEDTEITLTLRKHEGLKIRVEMPENEPLPGVVKVIYRKDGRDKGPMTNVTVDESGAGHTWVLYPATYDMTFTIPGYKPIERHVVLEYQGNAPVALKFEPL